MLNNSTTHTNQDNHKVPISSLKHIIHVNTIIHIHTKTKINRPALSQLLTVGPTLGLYTLGCSSTHRGLTENNWALHLIRLALAMPKKTHNTHINTHTPVKTNNNTMTITQYHPCNLK